MFFLYGLHSYTLLQLFKSMFALYGNAFTDKDYQIIIIIVCVFVCVWAHRAVEDHAVSIAQALDVCCQVEADGSMADGVHGLSIEEVMRSGWK